MRWSVSFYFSSKRNRKYKHLVHTKPMCENTITNIMKVSVAGSTSLNEGEKSLRIIVQGKQQSANWRKHLYVVSSEYIATVTGHRGINFLNDYDYPRAEKKQKLYLILAGVSDITTTVAPLTHRWQRRKKTNFLLYFRVLILKNFSMNPATMGSQVKTVRLRWTVVKKLSKCLSSLAARIVLVISKRQYTSDL